MRTPTQVTTNELKLQVEKSFELLKTLRDEARVELHLAGLDAKDEWEKLQPRIMEAEKAMQTFTHEAAENTRKTVDGALEALKKFKAELKTKRPPVGGETLRH